jgi:hypothetical protein
MEILFIYLSFHLYSSFRTKYFYVQDTQADNAIVGLGGNDQRFVNRRVGRICGGSADEFLRSNGKLFDSDSSDHLAGSADDDNLHSIDLVVDDDKLYGGDYISGDSYQSEPDLETNCEIPVFHLSFFRRCHLPSLFFLLTAKRGTRRRKGKRKHNMEPFLSFSLSFFLFLYCARPFRSSTNNTFLSTSFADFKIKNFRNRMLYIYILRQCDGPLQFETARECAHYTAAAASLEEYSS